MSDFCSLEDAFKGKPYCKDIEPIFKSYNVANKHNLLKDFKQKKISKRRLIKHYESPLTQVSENSFIEGRWRDNPQLENKPGTPTVYPYPYSHEKKFFDSNFIKTLKGIMIDRRRYAIPYNDLEVCRLCFKTLSNKEYTLHKDNMTFRFNEGLLHYYLRHNVWPSKKFYTFVMNY